MEKVENELEKLKKNQKNELKKLEAIKEEYIELNEEVLIQEHGLFIPSIRYEMSDKYKVELDKIQEEREKAAEEKSMLREQQKLEKEIEKKRNKLEKELKHFDKEKARLLKELESNPDQIEKERINSELEKINDNLKVLSDENEELEERLSNTRAGYVYIISNIGSFGENIYKIGVTRRQDPLERVRELGDASVPFKFDVHALIFAEDAFGLENQLHKKFRHKNVNAVNKKKEFFDVHLDEIKDVVQNHYFKPVNFTDIPEAIEYRESIILNSQSN